MPASGCDTRTVYLTDREDMGLTEEQMKENDEKKWYLRGYERGYPGYEAKRGADPGNAD